MSADAKKLEAEILAAIDAADDAAALESGARRGIG
jgi:hypothetical protein